MSGAVLIVAAGSRTLVADFGGGTSALDAAAPFNATASVTLETDGSVTVSATPTASGNTITSPWHVDGVAVGRGTGIWVEATQVSGTTNGTFGSRLQLSSARTWSISRTTDGSTTGTVRLDFYRAAVGGSLVGSQSISLTATATA